MIYFIQEEETSNIKIGYSKNIDSINRRVHDLQTGNSNCLVLLGYCNGTIENERYLHFAFRESNIRGEWFNIDPIDIEGYIDNQEVDWDFEKYHSFQTELHKILDWVDEEYEKTYKFAFMRKLLTSFPKKTILEMVATTNE